MELEIQHIEEEVAIRNTKAFYMRITQQRKVYKTKAREIKDRQG